MFGLRVKAEWGDEYRYHCRGTYGDSIRIFLGIHSPTPPLGTSKASARGCGGSRTLKGDYTGDHYRAD